MSSPGVKVIALVNNGHLLPIPLFWFLRPTTPIILHDYKRSFCSSWQAIYNTCPAKACQASPLACSHCPLARTIAPISWAKPDSPGKTSRAQRWQFLLRAVPLSVRGVSPPADDFMNGLKEPALYSPLSVCLLLSAPTDACWVISYAPQLRGTFSLLASLGGSGGLVKAERGTTHMRLETGLISQPCKLRMDAVFFPPTHK